MERKLDDVGHRVETKPGCGLISDITHAAPSRGEGGQIGSDARGRLALQGALKQAAAVVGTGIQDRRDQVIAYARREPETALKAAAAFGLLVGFALAISSRGGTSSGRAWLPQLTSRPTFRGRRRGSGWRGFLRLE
jgi:hypothetical protein